MGKTCMSSVRCDRYPSLGLARTTNVDLGRDDFQMNARKGWGKGSAMIDGWCLCRKVIFWAVMEGCLIAIGIDDLVDYAEFSLAEETCKHYTRTTSKELVINKAKRPQLWGSAA